LAEPYTVRFVAHRGTGETAVDLFTVPAGYVFVLRDILLSRGTAQAQWFEIRVSSPGFPVLVKGTADPTTTLHMELRQTLLAGEIVQVSYGDGGDWSILMTGYQLTAAAA